MISSNERMVEPAHSVPLDVPSKLLETYGCHCLCVKKLPVDDVELKGRMGL